MNVVRLSALRTGRFYHPENILSQPQGHSAVGRITRVGPKVFDLTYKSRAKCKMLRGIYSAIYGDVLLLSVGLPVANAPDVLQPCGLLYYP